MSSPGFCPFSSTNNAGCGGGGGRGFYGPLVHCPLSTSLNKAACFLKVDDAGVVLRLGVALVVAEAAYSASLVCRRYSSRRWRRGSESELAVSPTSSKHPEPASVAEVTSISECSPLEEDLRLSPLPQRGSAHCSPLRRVTHYWELVKCAIRDGVTKAPGKATEVNAIGRGTSRQSQRQSIGATSSSLLVLPDEGCFMPNHCELGDAAAQRCSGAWDAFHFLWVDSVRYIANVEEISNVLLNARAQSYMRRGGGGGAGPSSYDVSAANLSMVWYLANLRAVHNALIERRDTRRCEEELDALEEHRDDIYKHFIAPWINKDSFCAESGRDLSVPAGLRSVASTPPLLTGEWQCMPDECWAVMRAAETRLRRLRRGMYVGSIFSLFRYMYASSHSKLASCLLMAVLTGLSSRVSNAGTCARERVGRLLTQYYSGTQTAPSALLERVGDGKEGGVAGGVTEANSHGEESDAGGQTGGAVPIPYQVAALCGFELCRIAVNIVLAKMTHQYITATASQRRDLMKRELYSVLTHLPLSFYDLHSYDDIEEMVYYANDMEGVDVHIHQFLFTAATALLAMRAAMVSLSVQARVLIVGSVAFSYAVKAVGAAIGRWYRRCERDRTLPWLFADTTAAVDAQTEENADSGSRKDGIMLRGLEIVAALPQLRPYGADVELMDRWNEHILNYTTAGNGVAGGGASGLVIRPRGKMLPALGNALLTLMDWLIPVLVSTYGASTSASVRRSGSCGSAQLEHDGVSASLSIMAGMSAVAAVVDVALDAQRVVEVVLSNAYKASVLERVCDPSQWETTRCSVEAAAGNDIARSASVVAECFASYPSDPTTPLLPGNNISAFRGNSSIFAATSAAPPMATAAATIATLFHPFTAMNCRVEAPNYSVSRIIVSHLQFRYPSAPTVEVFRHPFSADIKLRDSTTGRGRLICLVGPSGCGKSTLISLLLGLYTKYHDPTASEGDDVTALPQLELELTREDFILPSGGIAAVPPLSPSSAVVPVSSVPCEVLRRRFFGFVPQQPSIFSGATIAHNISLNSFVSIEEEHLLARAQQCADLAHCDFTRRFPQGLLTPISDASSSWAGSGDRVANARLSGGQGQRLMVARALYQGGGVLLMDEPTANLDATTRSAMVTEWRQLLDDGVLRGIVCSTHDDALMAAADEIISVA